MRDPRISPVTGDVFRKWDRNYLVTKNVMGAIYTMPSLSGHREWVGIKFFREWAKTAEVMHERQG